MTCALQPYDYRRERRGLPYNRAGLLRVLDPRSGFEDLPTQGHALDTFADVEREFKRDGVGGHV